ncbi:winged helix-turn-helix transcriptional regulator [Streptosporangium sp. NBC_01756]|uniref:winged helix-turn-helix transcriptional regulator n=1 Tax=Streptosporangium sp. NBC_01756 TaxID=2975950 RepID=UPI002DD8ED7F|nr:helix-turn-helix domain-containing protein [Streptosporangium sp. NBC_01756]WSC83251.1 helix-turn-helix transcriptional regulator [Streptosporangium sp. NBC_01756]
MEEGSILSHRHSDVPSLVSTACPVSEVLDRVAGKWSIGILMAAAHGPVRFSELERSLTGVSRRMLTLNLRKLERDGLLVRTVHPSVPPKVEYTVTEAGRALHDALLALTAWTERYRDTISTAQALYDRDNG